MWNLTPSPNPDSGYMDEKQFDLHIEKLKSNEYDGVILFCQTEFEFYNIPRYHEILSITVEKNLTIYAIMGLDHTYDAPNNVKVISWPTNFCREALEQVCHHYYFQSRNIESPDDVLINDLDELDYEYHFVYLNGKSHNWRSLLIDTVAKHDLLKYSAYSWHSNYMGNESYDFKWYDGSKKILDPQYDTIKDQGWMPAEYYRSFFQLVPESTLKAKFLTEKTMVPLIVGKPFLIAGAVDIHRRLEDLGFKLYDELFDYSFDSIKDTEERYDAICEQVKNITNMPLAECKKFHDTLQSKIIFNRERVIELAYDQKYIPDLVQEVIKYYDDTGIKLDWWLIETELRLRQMKDKYFNRNIAV